MKQTAPAGLVIDLNAQEDGTTAVGFRRGLAVLFDQEKPGVARGGRLGSDHFVVTGDPNGMNYFVSGGGLLITRAENNGVYLIGQPQGFTCEVPPLDGINPRYDRIYAMQPDPALDGTGVSVDFYVDVAVGIAGADPQIPAIPDGAIQLGLKILAADAKNTATGVAIQGIPQTTGLSFGGTVPIRQGGTGGTTKASARAGIGVTSGPTVPSAQTGDEGDWYARVL